MGVSLILARCTVYRSIFHLQISATNLILRPIQFVRIASHRALETSAVVVFWKRG